MKVSVNINGVELKLDGEVDETVDFVQKLQAKEKKVEQEREQVRAERKEKAKELNAVQYELWDWMVDNDCEIGIPIAAAARHFNLGETCVGQRMARLANLGYAYRTGRGRYRPIEK